MSGGFFWGPGGRKTSADERALRRKALAEKLMKGTDAAPVKHWVEGAARVGKSIISALEYKDMEAQDAKASEEANKALASALFGGASGAGAPSAQPMAMGSMGAAGDKVDVKAPENLAPLFAEQESAYGLPSGYLARTAQIESSFNPNAKNPNSSASGLFQFINSTAKQYGLDNPMDPVASTQAAARLAADNAKVLARALGRAPTAGELYLAHQQGAGRAAQYLANPNARAVDVAGRDAIVLNGGNPNMTTGEFANKWMSKFGGSNMPVIQGGQNVAQMPIAQGAPNVAPMPNAADLPAPNAGPVSLEQGTLLPGGAVPFAENEDQVRFLERRMAAMQGQPMPEDVQANALPQTAPLPPQREQPQAPAMAQPAPQQVAPQQPAFTPQVDPFAEDGGAKAFAAQAAIPMQRTPDPAQIGQPAITATPLPPEQSFGMGRAAPANAQSPNAPAQQQLGRQEQLLMIAANPNFPAEARQVALAAYQQGAQKLQAVGENIVDMSTGRVVGQLPQSEKQRLELEKLRREANAPTIVPAGSSVVKDGQEIYRAPARDDTATQIKAREAEAQRLGMKPGDPGYQGFVLTGKMPREDAQPLTATDKKAIMEADDAILAGKAALSGLAAAKELSAKAYEGPTASMRGYVTSLGGSEAGSATVQLDNVLTSNALTQLKAIFGAAPTEGERKILLEIQGASRLPHADRIKIIERAEQLAQRRLELAQRQADELRGGTYYKPQGQKQQGQSQQAPQAQPPDRAAIEQELRRRGALP